MAINPLTASMYVDKLAERSGLYVLGESGMVKNMKTSKILNNEGYTNIPFVRDVSTSGMFPWLLIGGPFLVPYSLYFMIKSTADYRIYNIHHKHDVERGIYDKPSFDSY